MRTWAASHPRVSECVAVHTYRNGAGALQGTADGGAVAELGERVPAHSPLDERRHVRAGREPALALEIDESAQPLPIGRDELADEPLGIERVRIDARIAPPRHHALRKLGEADGVVLGDGLGDRGAHAVLPGAGGKEARPMRRVLDVVGEGDGLGIIVVARRERLAEGHAQQAGCPGTEDDQRLPRSAVGAVPTQLAPVAARDHALRAEHGHETMRAASGTSGGLAAGMHEAAGVAERGVDAAHAARRILGREEVPHVDVAGEEPVIEDTQVLVDTLLGGTPDRAPAGDAALAALDERQVD